MTALDALNRARLAWEATQPQLTLGLGDADAGTPPGASVSPSPQAGLKWVPVVDRRGEPETDAPVRSDTDTLSSPPSPHGVGTACRTASSNGKAGSTTPRQETP